MNQNRFRVVSPFEPAGDQPEAIDELVRGLDDGLRYQTLLGVTGSGKTFTMAKVIERVQKPTLVMAPNKTLAAQLASELKDFLPDNAVVYFVSYYDYYQPEAYVPSTDTFIEKDASINDEVEKLRHAATAALLSRKDVVVVASVSCIYGIGSPEDYAGMAVFLGRGKAYDRDELIRDLIDIQYDRNDYELTRGTLPRARRRARRLPARTPTTRCASSSSATRSSRSPRSTSSPARCSPRSTSCRSGRRRTTSPSATKLQGRARRRSRRSSAARLAELKAEGKLLEAQRLEMRVNYDLEMLETMGFTQRHRELLAAPRRPQRRASPPNTLIDYFGEDFLCIIDESHVTVPADPRHARGRPQPQDHARRARVPAAERAGQPAAALRRVRGARAAVRLRLGDAGRLRAAASAQQIVEQIIRPTGLVDPEIVVRPIEGTGRRPHRRDQGRAPAADERILVTTLTKKMAEDLTDYLFEQGIRVRYLHSRHRHARARRDPARPARGRVRRASSASTCCARGSTCRRSRSSRSSTPTRKASCATAARSSRRSGARRATSPAQVIMYADKVTDSMRFAIDETNRRREKQVAYNAEHGIEPQTIRKAIADIVQYMHEGETQATTAVEAARELAKLPRDEVMRLISTLEEDMAEAAEALDFESAARLRDQAVKLRAEVESSSTDEVLARLKKGARKGSEYGRRKRR